MSKRPNAIDLFSGCGGMSLGLEAAGFDIAASVEFDAVHSLVHHYNFPYSATICKDIAKLSSEELLEKVRNQGFQGDIDLIAGGPPCQGFSQIGKRQLDDPRNSLVFEYLRFIREIQPKYFIFENVPGIATGQHKKFLFEIIDEFENSGYTITLPFQLLDAVHYGAPQKRKRLILLGSRNDVDPLAYPSQSHSDICAENLDFFTNTSAPFTTVGDAISDLVDKVAFTNGDKGISSSDLDYKNFRKNYSLSPSGAFKLCHKRAVGHMVWGHLGSKHAETSIQRFAETEPDNVEKVSRFLKLSAKGQCNTLRAGTASDKGAYTAPRPIHYEVPRCISVREAARLHTFPDWFQFHNTIWHGFREIGNAVVPLLSKAFGDQIIKNLGVDQEKLRKRKLKEIDRQLLSYNMSEASYFWGIPNDVIPTRKRLA